MYSAFPAPVTEASHSSIHSHIHGSMVAAALQGTAHWEQFSVKCLAQRQDNGLGGSGI